MVLSALKVYKLTFVSLFCKLAAVNFDATQHGMARVKVEGRLPAMGRARQRDKGDCLVVDISRKPVRNIMSSYGLDHQRKIEMKVQEKTKPASERYDTSNETKQIVWIQAAGHCELCGTDLTHDYRVGKPIKWGEVAHIMPASPKGPRGRVDHDGGRAQSLTNDSANLMLLCPSCHDKIDRDAEGYPENDLSGFHQAYLKRIWLAATAPDSGRAIPIIVQSQHLITTNEISDRDLLTAMSSEGLAAFESLFKVSSPCRTLWG